MAALGQHLAARYYEREEVVEGALVALGSAQHALIVGPPGTAKSELIAGLASSIDGASYFQWLLTKFSTPEEVFGPVSLKALEQDSYRRVTAGKLPEAHIAFLDEVFKANSSILNSLLSIVNERLFHNDGAPARVPLISLFGASNELPQGEEETALAAFADRFLLRYETSYIAEDAHFASMLAMSGSNGGPRVSLQDLWELQTAAQAVTVSRDVLDAMVTLRRELVKEGITASDRRWRQAVTALRAKAALAGASEVTVDRDFDILVHILWNTPDQKKPVAKVIRRVADPLAERVTEALEEAEEIYKAAVAAGDNNQGIEANGKLKKLVKELEALLPRVAPGSKPRVERAIQTVGAWNKEVLKVCLKIDL